MKKPVVAIVGRPNVGKSTLFNILTDTRKALVKNEPGVTRDLIIEEAELWGKTFDLVDTGGITEKNDLISNLIREQVTRFLSTVDLVLFVVDGRDGIIPEDRDVFRLIQESGRPFLVIANKIDRLIGEDQMTAEFYEFGEHVYAAAFEQRRGLAEILEKLHSLLPESASNQIERRKLTIVGKPNVGKSSLLNRLLGSERVLVSPQAGTTLDSVEVPFEWNGQPFTFIDTAGLRKSAQRTEDLEILSAFKSHQSLARADVVMLVVDAQEGPTEQDAKIMQAILESHKAVIVVANKIDRSEDTEELRKNFRDQCEREFHFFKDAQIAFISTVTGEGLPQLFNKVQTTLHRLTLQISTGDLNDFFAETIRKAPAPVWANTNVKFYYLTQTRQEPPSFIAFANHPEGVDPSYRRFLINQLKDRFTLHGIPIRIFVMKSRR